MDGFYALLVKTTLVAAVLLMVISVGTAIFLNTVALLPMLALAALSGGYAWTRIARTSSLTSAPE